MPLMFCSVWPRRCVMTFSVCTEKISFSFFSFGSSGLKSPVMTKPAFSPSSAPLILRLSHLGGRRTRRLAKRHRVADTKTNQAQPSRRSFSIFFIEQFMVIYCFV